MLFPSTRFVLVFNELIRWGNSPNRYVRFDATGLSQKIKSFGSGASAGIMALRAYAPFSIVPLGPEAL